MRYVRLGPVMSAMVLIFCAAALVGCGSDRATLTSVTVSPQQATGTATVGKVIFTATANFSNNTQRQLGTSDGVRWSTSDISIATIDNAGGAVCNINGTVTVTATEPANTGANNTSQDVSGTASLKCLLFG